MGQRLGELFHITRAVNFMSCRFKMGRNGHKISSYDPKMAEYDRKYAGDDAKRVQDAPKMGQNGIKMKKKSPQSSLVPLWCLLGASLVPPWCLPGASLHPLTWSQGTFCTPQSIKSGFWVPFWTQNGSQHRSQMDFFG